MGLTPTEELRVLLREEQYPFFTETELNYHLVQCAGVVNAAAYRLLLIKAENDSITVSGLTTADTAAYWRRLAMLYRPNASGVMRGG